MVLTLRLPISGGAAAEGTVLFQRLLFLTKVSFGASPSNKHKTLVVTYNTNFFEMDYFLFSPRPSGFICSWCPPACAPSTCSAMSTRQQRPSLHTSGPIHKSCIPVKLFQGFGRCNPDAHDGEGRIPFKSRPCSYLSMGATVARKVLSFK